VSVSADLPSKGLSVTIAPRGLMKLGYGMLGLGQFGLVILWIVQFWQTLEGNDQLGDKAFVAASASEVLVMGPLFVVLAYVSGFVLAMHGSLVPRAGRVVRVVGLALIMLGIAGGLLCWWAESENRGNLLLVAIFSTLAMLIAGIVLLLTGSRRTRSFAQRCRTRLGTRGVYPRRGFSAVIAVIAALWAGALAWYLVGLFGGDPGWTVQPGGYIGAGLLALGFLGALAFLFGPRGAPILIDREGEIVEPGVSGEASAGA
jgi:hypothetical protein